MKNLCYFYVFLLISMSFNMHCCDISNLDKAEVLRALYAQAKPQGLGRLHYVPGDALSDAEVKEVLSNNCVKYLKTPIRR